MVNDAYERFMSALDMSAGPDGCHLWTRGRDRAGYGKFKHQQRDYRAHRWLMGHLRGDPLRPEELVLHRCDTPSCCNPKHLYVGTHAQNTHDMYIRGRARLLLAEQRRALEECKHGHPFDEENTIWRPEGGRKCRTCNRANAEAWRARAKLAVGY